MQVQAILKNVPMSPPENARGGAADSGLPALHALAVLAVVPRKGARFVAKTLQSAICQCRGPGHQQQIPKIASEALIVKEAVAQTSTIIGVSRPRRAARRDRFSKRRCHIKIVLSDK